MFRFSFSPNTFKTLLCPLIASGLLAACGGSPATDGTTPAAAAGASQVSPTQDFSAASKRIPPVVPVTAPTPTTAPTKLFGYALIDCGYDDPLDAEVKTNYVSEVAAFSNVAQMCAYDPSDNVVSRLQLMADNQMQAMLSIQGIFFEGKVDATQGSGVKFTLYPDYQTRWNNFVHNNNLTQQVAKIAAVYIADEPGWNGISSADLKTAADAVKVSLPTVPVALTEAASMVSALHVPTSVDWIGLVHYAIPNPETDLLLKTELALLKSKRSSISQKIFLMMDAQWLPFYGEAGYAETYMATVASAYYNMTIADPDVVALIGYTWAGGVDNAKQKGVRELPASVIAEHARIGKLLTGK